MIIYPSLFRPDLTIPLIAGHFIGDFLLQPDWMVTRKGRSRVALLHATIVAVATGLLFGNVATWWWLLPVLLLTHMLVDLIKASADRRIGERSVNGRVTLFLLDQTVHLVVLVAVTLAATSIPAFRTTLEWGSLWIGIFGTGYLKALVLVTGWVVAAPAIGVFLGLMLRRFEAELTPEQKAGLTGGGYWIGLTERSLIYLFILLAEPSGIGFLAAAKSVFRIGELKEADERKLAEYILIGTLMSFALAMVVGLLTRAALDLPALQ